MTTATDTTAAFNLNDHTYRLLVSEPFFASISRNVHKTASTAIPTAGVRINKETKQFEMLYNPEFFAKLPDNEKIGVLMHEFYHLVFDHVTDRLPPEGMTRMWNVATDLAINGLPGVIDKIPSIGCIPGKGPFAHYPAEMSADYYMDRLKQDKEQQEQDKGEDGDKSEGGEGSDGEPNSMDDHSGWGEADGDVKGIAQERMREILKEAANDAAKSNNWGSVSSSMRETIMAKLRSYIDWKSMLRYFIKATVRSDKHSTIRKINKRFPRVHAGKKVTRVANVAISIDQSGSVGDDMLAAFFTELNKLSEIATFTVVPFDTDVGDDKVFVWKKGQTRKWERVMCGGTDFNAPTKWVNDRNFDGHIVLTDMCAPKPVASKPKRMWITTKDNFDNPYFKTNEIVVAIDCK